MHDKLLEKLSEELTLQQKWKDGIWLQEQITTNRLNPLFLDYIPQLSKILDEVYPNNWDMDVNIEIIDLAYQAKYKKQIKITISPVILFKDITIKNSEKKTLSIKNIFVKIPLQAYNYTGNINKILFDRLAGRRSTFTYNEYSNGYIHSHLPSLRKDKNTEKYLSYQSFCLGSGEINFMLSKINTQYTDNMFKTILFHIQGYLEWESLEGRPYMHLEQLFFKSKSGSLHYFSNKDCEQWVNSILQYKKKQKLKDNIEPDLDWHIVNDEYKLKDNEKLEEFCRFKGTEDWKNDYNSNGVCYKDNLGNYYPSKATTENIEIPNESIPFQGKQYKLEVSGLLDDSDRQFYIHPKIKKYVRNRLEYIANKQAIRESITQAAH